MQPLDCLELHHLPKRQVKTLASLTHFLLPKAQSRYPFSAIPGAPVTPVCAFCTPLAPTVLVRVAQGLIQVSAPSPESYNLPPYNDIWSMMQSLPKLTFKCVIINFDIFQSQRCRCSLLLTLFYLLFIRLIFLLNLCDLQPVLALHLCQVPLQSLYLIFVSSEFLWALSLLLFKLGQLLGRLSLPEFVIFQGFFQLLLNFFACRYKYVFIKCWVYLP